MRFRSHIVSHRIDTPVSSGSSKLRKENDATISKNNPDIEVSSPKFFISYLGSYKSNIAIKLHIKAKARCCNTAKRLCEVNYITSGSRIYRIG